MKKTQNKTGTPTLSLSLSLSLHAPSRRGVHLSHIIKNILFLNICETSICALLPFTLQRSFQTLKLGIHVISFVLIFKIEASRNDLSGFIRARACRCLYEGPCRILDFHASDMPFGCISSRVPIQGVQ